MLWSAINHVTGRHSQRLPPSAELSTLTNHLKKKFHHFGPACELPFGSNRKESSQRFTSVSVAEVERLLSRLVRTKAPGPDTIRPSELKLVAKVIAPTVTILFNESLATGELHQEFKAGNLSPQLKPGKTDTALLANYRAIPVTSILSKVLEKIVCKQITSYLDQKWNSS